MSIKENDNQIYTKYYDDPVNNYLRNIIQRYFEIEKDISLEKRENLIIQAYTRLKEILNAETSDFILCINEKSGSIYLSIKDLGGEEKFDKNTAFNKNFDSYTTKTVTLHDNNSKTYNHYGKNLPNTIVEGNDYRLEDARIPLAHVHDILEIEGLEEFLNENNINPNAAHLHKNKSVLDLIRYTGSMLKIDLVILENLKQKVDKTFEMFTETDEYVDNSYKKYLGQLKGTLTPLQNRFNNLQNKIDEWINFYNNSIQYTDSKRINYINQLSIFLNNYLTKKEFNTIKNTINKSIKFLDAGYINFSNSNFSLDKYESFIINKDDSGYSVKVNGYTLVSLKNNLQKKIPNNIISKIQSGNINNSLCRVLFEYDKNGKHFCDELPQIYQINDSKNDYIYVYNDTDSNNNINIYIKRISYIPVYLYNSFVFYAKTIDNENNESNYSSICLENINTETKYFSINQDQNIIKDNDELIEEFNEDITSVINTQFNNPDIHYYNNKTYLFVINDTKKWKDAEKLAVNLQGHLAMPKTDAENIYITNIYKNYIDNGTPVTSLWLGGTDMNNEGEWEWVDGTTIKNDNWFDGEPDNLPGYAAHYMELKHQVSVSGGGYVEEIKWTDNKNKVLNNYVVELNRKNLSNNTIILRAESFKENDTDKYNTKVKLTWSLFNLSKYHIRIFRKYNYEYSWQEVYRSTKNSLVEEYIDTIHDNRNPNLPELYGKCIYKSDTQDKYEITINYSDQDEFIEYKMQIFDPDWTKTGDDFENSLILKHETNSIIVSSFSGINHLEYLINQNGLPYNSNPYINISIKQDDIAKRKQVLSVIVNKEAYNNKIRFCDTYHSFKASEFNDFYKEYNCHLLNSANTSINYLNVLANPCDYETRYHVLSNGQPISNTGSFEYEGITDNTKETEQDNVLYFNGEQIVQEYNSKESAFGEYEFKSMTSFFSNPKFKYQLFLVPNRGETL